jgi:hypothetical protein
MLKVKMEKRIVDGHSKEILVINDKPVENSYAFTLDGDDKRCHAFVRDKKASEQLAAFRFRDIEAHFESLKLHYEVQWNQDLDEVNIVLFNRTGRRNRTIEFKLQPDWEHWANTYSIAEYAEAIEEVVKTQRPRGVTYCQEDELVSNGFGIRCRVSSGNPVVHDEIERGDQMFKSICDAASRLLADSVRRNSVTTFFNFPPEVKTSCEQYLLYFVQFLQDLGITATAEIKEDARRVLFSVTPADGQNALAKVKEALEIYLRIPGAPEFQATVGQYQDMAVQQLQANVLHLQSQLTLANAAVQAQAATIETLQLSNYQYRQLLSSEIREKPQEKAAEEALVGDTVHLKKYEGKIVKVDLPLIFRRLKRVFGIGKPRAQHVKRPAAYSNETL